MTIKQSASLILISLLLFGCNQSGEDKLKERDREHNKIKTEIVNELASGKNITYNWDTLDATNRMKLYSIEFKQIINSKYQIISKFRINDIYEKDSLIHASIIAGKYQSFYFDFPITEEQKNDLIANYREIILVVNVQHIKKIKFVITGNLVDEETAEVDLDFGFLPRFIGTGIIIKFIPLNKFK